MSKEHREWRHACHFVRCSISVVEASVYQGQYPVWIPCDEELYNAVVECYALKPDLEILEDGDAREVGARGVSLLGSRNMKYVLLDNPLSAVVSCPIILPDRT